MPAGKRTPNVSVKAMSPQNSTVGKISEIVGGEATVRPIRIAKTVSPAAK
jgi:hypothetical protein